MYKKYIKINTNNGDIMRNIDLKDFEIRTDLVADIVSKDDSLVKEEIYEENNIKVSNIKIDSNTSKLINKKEGFYTTIYFDDITDHTNFKNVKEILIKELKKILDKENIKKDFTCTVIGLGNEKSTPDALGSKTVDNIIVTKHIYDLTGSLEQGYRVVSSFTPGVMGTTGIETLDIIESLINKIKPDFLIVIDSLASDSIDRVTKTIQITNAGINPGSGIGNKRKEISKEKLNIPVIAIGVPMVVDATTIVSDTINYMQKHFSYNLKNKNKSDKLIPSYMKNYLKYDNLTLSKEEKNYFLGAFGNLSDIEKKSLIFDVLTPIGYNFIVTLKEIDFLLDKLSKLLAESINNILHDLK